jgi:hypothetical protein
MCSNISEFYSENEICPSIKKLFFFEGRHCFERLCSDYEGQDAPIYHLPPQNNPINNPVQIINYDSEAPPPEMVERGNIIIGIG